MNLTTSVNNQIFGSVQCPGDKSISQRVLMIGALMNQEMIVDGFLHGEKIKMITDSSYFLGQASFTSCNHEHPHFAIVADSARLDVGKQIVTGPAFLQILDIPTPLFLPFAFFPIMEKRASSYIIPKFSDRREWGLGLLGGGYYWALNDHIDIRVTGDIYSRGSWGVNAASSYKYRYRY